MISQKDGDAAVIELKFPVRAEFVSIARLTAAGVANRQGFDIEAIEDIKVALSEVCNRIICIFNKYSGEFGSDCLIKFILFDGCLGIEFHVEQAEKLGGYMAGDASAKAGSASEGASDMRSGARGPCEELRMEECEAQIQLTFINVLMDEFIVNPGASCLVSMKKYVE